jgi:pyruvate kinase
MTSTNEINKSITSVEPIDLSSPHALLSTLQKLRQQIDSEGQATFDRWRSHIQRTEFRSSALNLAQYLALRRHDLRSLQAALMPWGLSSLGRIEARVMSNLDAVIATLAVICGDESAQQLVRVGVKPAGGTASPLGNRPPIESFFEGDRLLQQHTAALFGRRSPQRRVRIMVTLPTEAATDYDLVKETIRRGATCLRINCAHDNPEIWAQTIEQIRRAERETGTSCKIMMDLGGPKIRTGQVLAPLHKKRVFRGDRIVLSRCLPELGCEVVAGEAIPSPGDMFQTCCTVPEIIDLLAVDAPVYIDDGKIRSRVVDTQYPLPDGQLGLLLEVTHASPKGVKLQPEKGLNFPNTVLPLSPLTEKDLADLDFVAIHADIIGYSFVQRPADIELLQQELDRRTPSERGSQPAIVAKIETAIAVSNLPELIVRAAGKQAFGVMIARGDLAVEIGYQRLAEIQEEILWVCEAAHVPVIWATQVLESLVKNGAPSRGEMTDAAMAERAECVMLNKGPFIAEAISILDDVLVRMETHQSKKTPQLRALHSW